MPNITNITPPRVNIIDPRTGAITREWYRFFYNLFYATGGENQGAIPVIRGGTGQTSYTDGQLLIGNSTGNTLDKATLTAGYGITITNGPGNITIDTTIGVNNQENQTATANQTVFTLTTMTYEPGSNSLSVFVDGVNQQLGIAFNETSSTVVTFTEGLHVGADVRFAIA